MRSFLLLISLSLLFFFFLFSFASPYCMCSDSTLPRVLLYTPSLSFIIYAPQCTFLFTSVLTFLRPFYLSLSPLFSPFIPCFSPDAEEIKTECISFFPHILSTSSLLGAVLARRDEIENVGRGRCDAGGAVTAAAWRTGRLGAGL